MFKIRHIASYHIEALNSPIVIHFHVSWKARDRMERNEMIEIQQKKNPKDSEYLRLTICGWEGLSHASITLVQQGLVAPL